MTDILRSELRAHINWLAQQTPVKRSWAEARAHAELTFPQRWGDVEDIHSVADHVLDLAHGAVEVRVYRPENAVGTVLFVHGGGWVNGSVRSHDGSVRMLANRSGVNVVSVNYRKAPEHVFPAGLDDCFAVLQMLAGENTLGFEVGNLVISGESAGGNIAAVLAHRARDAGIELAGQALIYPATDARMGSESYVKFGEGYMLAAEGMEQCYAAYTDLANRENPEVSPLLATDFTGLAPAFITICECDALRDEGQEYGEKLRAAGVEVEVKEYLGATHGIWIMKAITSAAVEIVEDNAAWIKGRLRA